MLLQFLIGYIAILAIFEYEALFLFILYLQYWGLLHLK